MVVVEPGANLRPAHFMAPTMADEMTQHEVTVQFVFYSLKSVSVDMGVDPSH